MAETELNIRQLIGEAAEAGDYLAIEVLARWASSIKDITSTVLQAEGSGEQQIRIQTNPPPNPAQSTALKGSKSIGKRRSYPVFIKSGATLIKIAWSKSSKSEYQHKSSQAITMKLAEALAKQGRNGAVIVMEKVLPIRLDDGTDVPDYQVYVSLAWLRQAGMVKQHGRQGYTIKSSGDLFKVVDTAWANLAETKVL